MLYFRFGQFVLNLRRGCLQDGDAALELRPKSFAVLRELVEHSGQLMSKDELVQTVWPDVIVSDDSLAHCIRDIRRVMGPPGKDLIKTVPRRGYIFVADVLPDSADASETQPVAGALPPVAANGRQIDQVTFERAYLDELRACYEDDARYYVSLSAETSETSTPSQGRRTRSARRRMRGARPEYREWLQQGGEIQLVKLSSIVEAVDKYPCVILLGDPGCGKTTSLENLVYEYAGAGEWFPVPLHLGDIGPDDSIEGFTDQCWTSLTEHSTKNPTDAKKLLDHYLQDGKLLFLLDALNEMPMDGRRRHHTELRRFVDQWSASGNRFVVSCRVTDYDDELLGLQRIEIQPLQDRHIRQFVKKELPRDWETLWQVLSDGTDGAHRLIEMARNPYLLTVMIDVFEEDGQLIRNRADLMHRFAGILMSRTSGDAGTKLGADVRWAALSLVAFEMQRRSGFGTTVSTDDLSAVIPREIQVNPEWPPQKCDSGELLEAAANAGIIEMPADRRTVRFYHQLMQEFFAARHLLDLDPTKIQHFWRWPWSEDDMPPWQQADDNYELLPPPPQTGWEETTILATGLERARDGRLLSVLCDINPVLAGRCLVNKTGSVDTDVRQRIVDQLLMTVSDAEVALRVRIAAGDVLGDLGDPRTGEMVVIASGTFLLGEGADLHGVTVPEYRIGRFPVTNMEFSRFVDSGGYQHKRYWTPSGWQEIGNKRDGPEFWDHSLFTGANHPVMGLSWYECVAYCRWLSSTEDVIYRLPTEAEWEKAARGTDGRIFPWGNEFDAGRLNAREGPQKANRSTPVGVYSMGASPNGLFDTAGNGWEWCSTRWQKPYPYDADENEWSEDYLSGNGLRVLRGGSWNYGADAARCAHRFRFEPSGWSDRGGFRVVCDMPG